MTAIVVGGGMVGLAAASRLRDAGWEVRVWSADPPERTVSSIAAAVWYPFAAMPTKRVDEWGWRTHDELERLAGMPNSGVRIAPVRVIWRSASFDPELERLPVASTSLSADELPNGYGHGVLVHLPLVDTPLHLAWLGERLRESGVRLERRRVVSLAEAGAESSLVVNCTGLASLELADDPGVYPIRGQTVRVVNPGLDRCTLDIEDENRLTYIVPRRGVCVLGGTAEMGSWDLEPDAETARAILERCIALEPALAGAPAVEHVVGLRPGRSSVRLEVQELTDGVCIHNYGHGGSGITLAWGCANEVVELARAAM